jgi:hypothetical protein
MNPSKAKQRDQLKVEFTDNQPDCATEKSKFATPNEGIRCGDQKDFTEISRGIYVDHSSSREYRIFGVIVEMRKGSSSID